MLRELVLFVGFAVGCSRTLPESQRSDVSKASPGVMTPGPQATPARKAPPGAVTEHATGSSVAPLAPSAPSKNAEGSFRFPGAERVVALGDLHGDLMSAREALRLAGAIDEQDRWVGGKLVLVQVGDQLDRGDDEPEILHLLDRLGEEAKRSGGAVHVLNGNHELMNAVGDLRYVTEDGFRDYATVPVPTTAHLPPNFPREARGRFAAFAPGSPLARKLADRNTIAVVGGTLFAHAGVLPKHVRYGIDRINDEVRSFLRGEVETLPEVAASEDAPVWTRVYGGPNPSAEACRELGFVLESLAVKRLVVGHTVQQTGITSACDGRVYRVDVGLSDYYGTNPTQVLELRADSAKVLSAKVR